MHLVSFDVGIKNLAYCTFAIQNQWQISGWTCANLLNMNAQEANDAYCEHWIPSKKKADAPKLCGKRAKWRLPEANRPNVSECFCETHAKMQTQWIIPKKQHQTSRINKLKLAELQREYATIFPTESVMHKKSELAERIIAHYAAVCFQNADAHTVKSVSASHIDLITIGRAIKRQLDSDPAIEGTTHVIIENQISTIATRMKTIQGMIAQYFIMRFGDAVQIEFVSSHNKLKGFSVEKATEGASYKANKSDGIAICRRFFAANTEMADWLPEFERSKKRDDLADCFLQGVWYLKTNKLISYAEDLKINSVFVS
jgi:hypothetical protein